MMQMQQFVEYFLQNDFEKSKKPICHLIKKFCFEYYHPSSGMTFWEEKENLVSVKELFEIKLDDYSPYSFIELIFGSI